MNLKTIDEGFKIYSLCCFNDYIIDFRFNSITEKITELGRYSEFSQNETIVLDLVESCFFVFYAPSGLFII